jgi:hypothetical protein
MSDLDTAAKAIHKSLKPEGILLNIMSLENGELLELR